MTTQPVPGSPRPSSAPADRNAGAADPHSEVARLLARQHRTMHAVKALLSRGVSEAERASAMLLVTLAETGPVRAGALADAVHSDPSTVSRQTAQLVTRGLVERQPDPADGRAWRLALTAQGREFLTTLRAHRLALVHEVLRDWEPADVELLAGSLERFTDCLDRVRRELAEGTSPLLERPAPAPGGALPDPDPDPAEATP
ncbi:DNA-binding MarR family transcriptional regulator [Kineococcus xinjiangensis]|uniref:DNA-binding MarR family transcriptional regulator n=1 Tax=Kineococcus xinjiangensis TaxID=512762 RepID=A0A2S6IV04_9ACTN|nr:MarR family transcriptional regulator [Kineococcus xinjiangensis]PPK98107.1 DNA-binding MarR family transcriptional regulator [Kineococcus xinjiangensis]